MTEIVNGRLRMMGDRILVKPLAWEPSKILEVVRHGRPLRGEVIAVGPGTNPLKYKANAMGKKGLMDYSKHFRRTEVKPGDVVELGGLGTFDGAGYAFPEVIVNGIKHIVVTERDVCGICQ